MKANLKRKAQPRLVHIHAQCDYFDIKEQVEEEKSFTRLEEIRDAFNKQRVDDDRLVVKTRVINPTMF